MNRFIERYKSVNYCKRSNISVHYGAHTIVNLGEAHTTHYHAYAYLSYALPFSLTESHSNPVKQCYAGPMFHVHPRFRRLRQTCDNLLQNEAFPAVNT